MLKKFPIILFFIATAVPTAEEQAEAMQYGPNVRFRNAEFGNHSGALEECDGVAGKVPEAYAKCPTAEDAIAKYMDANAEAVGKARESAAASAQARQAAQDAAQAAQAATPAPATAKTDKPAPAAKPAAQGWTANS